MHLFSSGNNYYKNKEAIKQSLHREKITAFMEVILLKETPVEKKLLKEEQHARIETEY